MYERNVIETIVDSDGILWLNEKHIEEGLDHKHLREITTKYHSGHRKNRHELTDKPKKRRNRIFINKELAAKVIMDCRKRSAGKFRTKLRFKWYYVILTK